ncbi:PREDICTED: protein FAM217B [Chrysochloris asiatica]|uniref:Protein FAM217B n=1 Tax=Chrysochloris asiatica TaxID=185453 RepID=A0A9B0U050_CHRAS|nr:PREDICTED: protein FAM217B [Chrysochloris asiatica]
MQILNTNAQPPWTQVQHLKDSSGKRQNKSQVPCASSQLKSSLIGAPQQAEAPWKESIYAGGKLGQGPGCLGASGSSLFLDLQSMNIVSEDTDEDSASDLSDSERVPIPQSPLSPPDLRLRAEEFNPAYFQPYPEPGHARSEDKYPDFLPPPFNSWDLQETALLLNTEGKTDTMPRASGLLGRYIDRLVQLEWLQTQTVQTEKAKGTKGRPPAAPGNFWTLKSPRRSKLPAAVLARPAPPQEGPSKPGPARKKDLYREDVHTPCMAFQTPLRPLDMPAGSGFLSKKQALEARTEEKKKRSFKSSSKLQRLDLVCGTSTAKIHSNGNLRASRPSAGIPDSGGPPKAPKTQAHPALKKKGTANNGNQASTSSEKKLKPNGGKRGACKFK